MKGKVTVEVYSHYERPQDPRKGVCISTSPDVIRSYSDARGYSMVSANVHWQFVVLDLLLQVLLHQLGHHSGPSVGLLITYAL